MDQQEDFSVWLRRQLRRREWTAAELARRSGLSASRISDWLAGARNPNTISCARLADVFFLDLDEVLAVAGHRVATGPSAPDDPATILCAMLKRVRLTPDRRAALESSLTAWIEIDRAIPPSFVQGR